MNIKQLHRILTNLIRDVPEVSELTVEIALRRGAKAPWRRFTLATIQADELTPCLVFVAGYRIYKEPPQAEPQAEPPAEPPLTQP